MRPPGPVPVSVLRSMPCSAARRLASGLALIRSPSFVVPAEAGTAGVGALKGAAPACAGATSLAGAEVGASTFGSAAGAGAGAVLALDASSSSPAITAITVPTFTLSVPSATRICATVPSSTASNSIVALSVSISASRSPDLTVSPSFTSHLARVPSSIVGERAGIFNSIGMSRLVPVSLAGGACRYGFFFAISPVPIKVQRAGLRFIRM